MEQTDSIKSNLPDKNKLPDAIYRSKQRISFTQVSNAFIRDPNINRDAKMIMITLLTNTDGQWITHIDKLKSILHMGSNKIINSMQELTELGYLKRMAFRDKKTKHIKGFFLAYTDTPHMFNYHRNIKILEKQGMEVIPFKTPLNHHRSEIHDNGDDKNDKNDMNNIKINRKGSLNHHRSEIPLSGNQMAKNTNLKKEKNTNDSGGDSDHHHSSSKKERNKQSSLQIKKVYDDSDIIDDRDIIFIKYSLAHTNEVNRIIKSKAKDKLSSPKK